MAMSNMEVVARAMTSVLRCGPSAGRRVGVPILSTDHGLVTMWHDWVTDEWWCDRA